MSIKLGVYKTDVLAKLPEIAYDGTSACFDLYALKDTIIPKRGSSFVEVGVRITVPKGYYLEFAGRSGLGIKKGLQPHPGIIDTGYSGPLAVKMFNHSDEDQVIEQGKGAVQVKVHKIPSVELVEIDENQWNEYCDESLRGESGFGSSDNK